MQLLQYNGHPQRLIIVTMLQFKTGIFVSYSYIHCYRLENSFRNTYLPFLQLKLLRWQIESAQQRNENDAEIEMKR